MSIGKLVAGIGAAGVVALTGCSGGGGIINQGGDTKCKDFMSFEEKKQNDAITKMLKDQKDKEPSNLEVTGARTAVTIYCQTLGKDKSKISETPHL